MILVFTLLVILLLSVIVSWIRLIKEWKSSGFPGPFPLPIFGNGLLFTGDSHAFLNCLGKIGQQFGNIAHLHILSDRYLLTSSPKYIESIVSTSELITKGKSYTYLHAWLGQGLLTSSGAKWRTHRKFLTPAFHFNILQNFLPVFLKNSRVFVDKIKPRADGRNIDIFPLVTLAALDAVTESIMGICVNAQIDNESEYVKSIEKLSVIVTERMRNPFKAVDAIFNLLPSKKVQDEAIRVLHDQTNKVIESRKAELQKQNITSLKIENEHGIKNRHAFLDLLLLAEIDGKRMDDVDVREEVDTFMFEGHDTTTSGIVFSLLCISKHPEVQEKLIKEQREILADDFLRDPTFSEVQQMKYLDQVIRESLRIYPSVPLIERRITQDTDVSGKTLYRYTNVLIDILHMQRDPANYKDPMEFRPERFDGSKKFDSSFSWMPFSAGPRNCIGQKFAMLEMKAMVSTIVRHYELLPSGIEPILTIDLVLRSKNGVHIKFKPRVN